MVRIPRLTFRQRVVFLTVLLVVSLSGGLVGMLVSSHYLAMMETADEFRDLARRLREQEHEVVQSIANQHQRDDETALQVKQRSLAGIIARLAPTPMLTFQTEPLNDFCAMACRDRDVVLCYIKDTKGRIVTTYANEDHSALVSLIGEQAGRSVNDFAAALRKSDQVSEVVVDVIQDGQKVGEVVLAASRQGTLQQQAKTREGFQRLEAGMERFFSAMASSFNNQMSEKTRRSLILGVAAATIAILLGASAAFWLARTVTRPLCDTVTVLEAVAQGDLDQRLDVNGCDEIGRMAAALNCAIEAQSRTLKEVHSSAQREKQRSEQLRHEVAQREQAQAALQLAKEAAETANEAKSMFLANMSHEIRTPLNAILGFANVLLRDASSTDSPERREYLETIYTSGQHLLSLINDILDLSKIEAGQLEIERVRCSPYEIVAEVVSVLRVRSQEQGLFLEFQWPSGVPESIESDPSRLRQLLMNLVGNAIKFTKTGGVRVITEVLPDQNCPQLCIRVVDTGIGIPGDKLEAIFDPFVQADNTVTRRFGGTGLGLAICRRVVQALGGTISIHSRVDEGSTFTVTIPTGPLDGVKTLDVPSADGLRSTKAVLAAVPTSLAHARILLVEDGSANRKFISLILRRAGADVIEAEHGQSGVELAMTAPFDLILMDMQMPVMDGYSATRKLRQAGITTPIIALTAHSMAGDEKKCREAGCSGYLSKPIDPDLLLRTIGRALPGEGSNVADLRQGSPVASTEMVPLASTLPADDAEFREIVLEFIEHLQDQLTALHQAFARRDFPQIARLAHWLKGSGGTAGFPAFTQPAKQLEALAKNQQADLLERAIAEIDHLVRRILAYPDYAKASRVSASAE